jgi:integrase/recombinase XerD
MLMKSTGAENIIKQFTDWQKEQGKAEGTVKTYVGVLEKFQSWLASKEIQLTHMSKEDIQSYLDHLEDDHKTPGTIEKYLAAISTFSHFLGKPQLVLGIQRKEKTKECEIPESLEESEEKQLLREVESNENLRNITIVYTLLYTGIRVSELCALNVEDVQIEDEKGKLFVKDAKGMIERVIPLSKTASDYLKNYLHSLDPNRKPLFVSSVNKRISPRAVQYMLQKYNVNPHKLRHTFCQKLINKGIDINTVAKLAGHKDVNVTKRYARMIDELNLENAIDKTFL